MAGWGTGGKSPGEMQDAMRTIIRLKPRSVTGQWGLIVAAAEDVCPDYRDQIPTMIDPPFPPPLFAPANEDVAMPENPELAIEDGNDRMEGVDIADENIPEVAFPLPAHGPGSRGGTPRRSPTGLGRSVPHDKVTPDKASIIVGMANQTRGGSIGKAIESGKILGMCESTVRQIVANNGLITAATPRTRRDKWSIGLQRELGCELGQQCTFSITAAVDAVVAVCEERGENVAKISTNTALRYVALQLIIWNNSRYLMEHVNDESVIALRAEFVRRLGTVGYGRGRCYIRIAKVSIGCPKAATWQPDDELHGLAPGGRHAFYHSIIIAVDNEKGLVLLEERPYDFRPIDIQRFIKELLCQYVLVQKGHALFIMEQMPEAREAIQLAVRTAKIDGFDAGFELVDLPPCSPMVDVGAASMDFLLERMSESIVAGQWTNRIKLSLEMPAAQGEEERWKVLKAAISASREHLTREVVQAAYQKTLGDIAVACLQSRKFELVDGEWREEGAA
jgi:hypothetical protein